MGCGASIGLNAVLAARLKRAAPTYEKRLIPAVLYHLYRWWARRRGG